MKHAIILPALCVTACAQASAPANRPPLLEGTGAAVALQQAVEVGPLTLTPLHVVEDSRCAEGLQCVWEGRLIVQTRIDGPGGVEETALISGERQMVRGFAVQLEAVTPKRKAAGPEDPTAYRFTFQAD